MIGNSQRERLQPEASSSDGKLELRVVFTDMTRTAAALEAACSLSKGLLAQISVVLAQVVPYPAPLTSPPVPLEFTRRVVLDMIGRTAADLEEPPSLEIYLCRDRRQTLAREIPRKAVVVVGARSRWWPVWERLLARALRREGRRVVII